MDKDDEEESRFPIRIIKDKDVDMEEWIRTYNPLQIQFELLRKQEEESS